MRPDEFVDARTDSELLWRAIHRTSGRDPLHHHLYAALMEQHGLLSRLGLRWVAFAETGEHGPEFTYVDFEAPPIAAQLV